MEYSMEADLWEDHDWDGKKTSGASSLLLNIRGRRKQDKDIWRRTVGEARAPCGVPRC